MNKPVFPSYQDLLNEEAVSVPEALRLDTKPQVANQVIATDVWTDRSIFEQEVEHMWPRVWQMVCRETALQKPGDYFVYDIARYSILLVRTEEGERMKAPHHLVRQKHAILVLLHDSNKGTERTFRRLASGRRERHDDDPRVITSQ